MHVLVESYGATAVLTIRTPRFTHAVADQVGAEAMAAVSDEIQTYLINLSHVTSIGSEGVGVLVRFMKRIGRERRMELCAPSPAVRKVLRLTRMDSIFKIHASVQEGLDSHFAPRRNAG